MDAWINKMNEKYVNIRGTGDYKREEDYKLIEYKYDKFIIIIKISEDQRFLGIEEIKINQDFMNYKQKANLGTLSIIDNYKPE